MNNEIIAIYKLCCKGTEINNIRIPLNRARQIAVVREHYTAM